jgi:hypothetical protein
MSLFLPPVVQSPDISAAGALISPKLTAGA